MAKKTHYVVNGVEYDRLDEIPPEYRRLLADADGNGVPDVFEGVLGDSQALGELTDVDRVELKIASPIEIRATTQFEIDGHTYNCIEDVPAQFRDILLRDLPELAGEAAEGNAAPLPERPAAERALPQSQHRRPRLGRQPPAGVVTDLDRRWAEQRTDSRSARVWKTVLTVAAVVGLALLFSRLL